MAEKLNTSKRSAGRADNGYLAKVVETVIVAGDYAQPSAYLHFRTAFTDQGRR